MDCRRVWNCVVKTLVLCYMIEYNSLINISARPFEEYLPTNTPSYVRSVPLVVTLIKECGHG